MPTQAIILAGGLGTRLRSAVPDLPKCMALVNGIPFLRYLVDYLRGQGINTFIFALGYKSEVIEEYLNRSMPDLEYKVSLEEEPLGTGGAIKQACNFAGDGPVLVANGDTMFKVNVAEIFSFHNENKSDCTLSLKRMTNFDRYGVVELNPDRSILSFQEKQWYQTGLINGGVYVLNAKQFTQEDLPLKFSFEKDYLEALYKERRMFGLEQDAYFIDIGIPEDYEKAQSEII